MYLLLIFEGFGNWSGIRTILIRTLFWQIHVTNTSVPVRGNCFSSNFNLTKVCFLRVLEPNTNRLRKFYWRFLWVSENGVFGKRMELISCRMHAITCMHLLDAVQKLRDIPTSDAVCSNVIGTAHCRLYLRSVVCACILLARTCYRCLTRDLIKWLVCVLYSSKRLRCRRQTWNNHTVVYGERLWSGFISVQWNLYRLQCKASNSIERFCNCLLPRFRLWFPCILQIKSTYKNFIYCANDDV